MIGIDVTEGLKKLSEGIFLIEPTFYLDKDGDLARLDKETLSLLKNLQQEMSDHDCPDCQMVRSIPLVLSNAQDIITLENSFSRAGLISLPWQFIPGWRLEVNGKSEPIYRINDTTLGFFVPAGKVKAALYFLPPHFLAIFLGSFVFIVVVFVLSLKRAIFNRRNW